MTETDAVVEHYRTYHPRSRPGDKERKLVAARLREGYSVEDLTDAIDGCHLSAFHGGDNDRGTKYQSLSLIMRDSGHVQQFIEMAEVAAHKRDRDRASEETRARQHDETAKRREEWKKMGEVPAVQLWKQMGG